MTVIVVTGIATYEGTSGGTASGVRSGNASSISGASISGSPAESSRSTAGGSHGSLCCLPAFLLPMKAKAQVAPTHKALQQHSKIAQSTHSHGCM